MILRKREAESSKELRLLIDRLGRSSDRSRLISRIEAVEKTLIRFGRSKEGSFNAYYAQKLSHYKTGKELCAELREQTAACDDERWTSENIDAIIDEEPWLLGEMQDYLFFAKRLLEVLPE
jgi:hypothetical protein